MERARKRAKPTMESFRSRRDDVRKRIHARLLEKQENRRLKEEKLSMKKREIINEDTKLGGEWMITEEVLFT